MAQLLNSTSIISSPNISTSDILSGGIDSLGHGLDRSIYQRAIRIAQSLYPSFVRQGFTDKLVNTLSEWEVGAPQEIRTRLAPIVKQMSAEEILNIRDFLKHTDFRDINWRFEQANPNIREISAQFISMLLGPDSNIEGIQHLNIARERPVIFMGNHRSLIDHSLLDVALRNADFEEVGSRLTTLIAPKPFMEPLPKFMSLAFGVIKVPQTSAIQTENNDLTRFFGDDAERISTSLVLNALKLARERYKIGDHISVFPEGTRSRLDNSGKCQLSKCIPNVVAYLDIPNSVIIPWTHRGSERLLPIGSNKVKKVDINIAFGAPIHSRELLDLCAAKATELLPGQRTETKNLRRELAMDVVGLCIAELLPENERGSYREDMLGNKSQLLYSIKDRLFNKD